MEGLIKRQKCAAIFRFFNAKCNNSFPFTLHPSTIARAWASARKRTRDREKWTTFAKRKHYLVATFYLLLCSLAADSSQFKCATSLAHMSSLDEGFSFCALLFFGNETFFVN